MSSSYYEAMGQQIWPDEEREEEEGEEEEGEEEDCKLVEAEAAEAEYSDEGEEEWAESEEEEEEGGEEEWDEEEEDEGRGQLQLRWRGWGMKVRRVLRTRCGRLRLGLLCCTFVLFIGTVAAMPLKVDCVN